MRVFIGSKKNSKGQPLVFASIEFVSQALNFSFNEMKLFGYNPCFHPPLECFASK